MFNYSSRNNLDFADEICNYLRLVRKDYPRESLAVVFDIDDTLIYSSTRKPIPQVKKIYNCAKNNQITIFIVTARFKNRNNNNFTINELLRNGFGYFNNLYMMPYHFYSQNRIGEYKWLARNDIAKHYKIILNMGDQWTDLFSHNRINLPNHYYIIPDSSEGVLIKLKSYH